MDNERNQCLPHAVKYLCFTYDGRELRVLLIKTAKTWSFPGGKTESGEHELQTGRRELLEEVGLLPAHIIMSAAVRHEQNAPVALYVCRFNEDAFLDLYDRIKLKDDQKTVTTPLGCEVMTDGFWKSDIICRAIVDTICPYRRTEDRACTYPVLIDSTVILDPIMTYALGQVPGFPCVCNHDDCLCTQIRLFVEEKMSLAERECFHNQQKEWVNTLVENIRTLKMHP